MRDQAGQATVEWVAVMMLVAALLAATVAVAPRIDGRSLGGFLAHRIACAMKAGTDGGCDDGDSSLAAAYGANTAVAVRELAPNLVYEPGERQLPVDFRRCRSTRCADAPLDRDADVHRSEAGERATVFTRVMRRRGRLYVQYWFYYADSNTTWMGADRAWERSVLLPAVRQLVAGDWRWPGFHRDDWEGYQVRLEPDGKVWARATSHGHYQTCKHRFCRDEWTGATGWTRVSRGSHAGHLPLDVYWRPRGRYGEERRQWPRYPRVDMRERSSTAEGLRLVPLEPLPKEGYRPLAKEVKPPWKKRVYARPEDHGS